MINFRKVSRGLLGLVVVALLPLANASSAAIKLIVLTDNAEKAGLATEELKRSRQSGQRDVIRQQILEDIRKQRLEMEANGFVVGSDVILASKDAFPQELIKHRATSDDTYDSVLPDFAYPARNLNDSPFRKGRLLGFMPIRSEDNKIHEVLWAYAVPGIGNVSVEELSYRTIPGVTIKIAEPSGNIQINGNPGTYMVMSDEKGKRGVTSIEFITSDKLFTLTAYKPIKRDNKQFKSLIRLAESLY
jgi:hypothetical protein